MLDIKRIRTDFDAVAEKLATRGVDAAVLNEMKEIDAKRRDILVKVETLKAERNTVSAEIAKPSATRKMPMTRLLRCKPYLLKSKPWMLSWQTSMLN